MIINKLQQEGMKYTEFLWPALESLTQLTKNGFHSEESRRVTCYRGDRRGKTGAERRETRATVILPGLQSHSRESSHAQLHLSESKIILRVSIGKYT